VELQSRVLVDRSVDEVFSRLADLELSPAWAVASGVIERRKLTDGPVGRGTRFQALDQLLPGRPLRFVVEITEFEPDRYIAANWSEPIRGGWNARFQPRNGSTELTFTAEMHPTGVLRLIAPVIGAVARRAMKKDLANFKVWVESTPG